jgi:phosphoglycerol transferase MdoB-like AlkP superfamily enzyme
MSELSVEEAPRRHPLAPPPGGGEPSALVDRLRALRRDARLRLPLALLGIILVTLSLERALIVLALSERFVDAPPGSVARAFLVGLRFDLSIGCFLVSLPTLLLLLSPAPLRRSRWLQRALPVYGAAAATLVTLACVADFYFFEEFGERLDAKAIDYLQFGDTFELLWDQYPVARTVLGLGVLFALVLSALRRVAAGAADAGTWRAALGLTVCLPLGLALGMRGTTESRAINSAMAHFSPSMPVSQLTLNGLFTLVEAIDAVYLTQSELGELIEKLPEEQAVALARESALGPGDTLVDDPGNPLHRWTDTGRPRRDLNVVLVLMESHSAEFVEAMGGHPGLSPNLDALIGQSVFFENCFAVGSRTPYGMSGTVCGFPDLPQKSASTRPQSEGTFFTLAHVLEERGYESLFVYGGAPHFDRRQQFLRSNGFRRMVFEDDVAEGTFRTYLGWCDEDLFRQALLEFERLGERPFLALILTQSFHRPYAVPAGAVEAVDPSHPESDKLTGARYADHAIGRFIEQARSWPGFDRTLFVFIADHTGSSRNDLELPGAYRVPFLIHAPAVSGAEARRVATVCSQIDVAPTIMSLLGGRYEHTFFGRSVLDVAPEEGRAFMIRSSSMLAWVDATGRAARLPYRGGQEELVRFTAPDRHEALDLTVPEHGTLQQLLSLRGRATLQVAEQLFNGGRYNLGTAASR